jgi:HlyD family secretion protein
MTPTSRIAIVALVLAALLAAGAGLRAQGSPARGAPAATDANPSLTVATTTARRETLTLTLAANGNIAAWQEASIGAEASGQRITEVRAGIGDRVRRGQVLATFATDTLGAELAQARAALAEAQAAAAEAEANAQRARVLEPTGALSASQINQYLTAATTAQARVEAARAVLQSRQVRLSQAQVLAPDDGIISARSATVGAVLGGPGAPELFRLIRQGRLEWRAEVTSPELARLKPGVAATVTTAGGAQMQGRVRMIGPTVDPQTRNALVYVDVRPVAGSAGHALPGMFARGEFQLGSATALTVPRSAVVVREGFSYVMRIDPGNRIGQVRVRTGRAVGDRIEILEGLAPDVRIVASGGGFLNDGDLVRVVDAPAPAAAAEGGAKR